MCFIRIFIIGILMAIVTDAVIVLPTIVITEKPRRRPGAGRRH